MVGGWRGILSVCFFSGTKISKFPAYLTLTTVCQLLHVSKKAQSFVLTVSIQKHECCAKWGFLPNNMYLLSNNKYILFGSKESCAEMFVKCLKLNDCPIPPKFNWTNVIGTLQLEHFFPILTLLRVVSLVGNAEQALLKTETEPNQK